MIGSISAENFFSIILKLVSWSSLANSAVAISGAEFNCCLWLTLELLLMSELQAVLKINK